jgi:UDP-N-acetyl-2-amino-2-deoxyglucuronate dehydrogenase
MKTDKVRFALVGCGAITAKHMTALKRIETAEVAAVCDLNPEAAKTFGEKNGVPWYSDPHEMAEKETFDLFSILTPSGAHAPLMLELAPHGRHFVVEKPMALRIEDADRVIGACDEQGIKVFVVQQNRYNLPVRKLKEAIDAGRFGRMVLGTVRVRWCREQAYYDAKPWRGTWAQDGGVFTNQASHHIDMLAWMMGDVESVMSMTATRLAAIEAEDTGVAALRFCNGALGMIEATTATRPRDLEGSISILGEKGAVEIGGFFMNELKTWQFKEPLPGDEEVFEKWGRNPDLPAWNHEQYLRDVIRCLQEDRRGLVEGLEGRKSLELINALYESAESGQMVSLRFRPRFCRLGQGG